MPDLDHHLLCPMQCRANFVVINKCPRMYCREPTQESHAIVPIEENGASVVLPFLLRGVTSYLTVMPLTRDKFEHHGCTQIELTSRDLTWDPLTDIYEDQENSMMDYQGDIIRPGIIDRGHLMVINSITVTTCLDAADVVSDKNFGNVLQANVNVSHIKVLITYNLSCLDSAPSLGNIQSTIGKQVNSETLAKRWNIDQRKAMNTFKQTTQRGVKTCLHPSLARRFPTNDRMMRYKRLPHPVFMTQWRLALCPLVKISMPRPTVLSTAGRAYTL